MVQLDALGVFAVLAVLVGHFTPTTSKLFLPFKLVDLDGLGVRLFFVITASSLQESSSDRRAIAKGSSAFNEGACRRATG